jgi:hypothetical protein
MLNGLRLRRFVEIIHITEVDYSSFILGVFLLNEIIRGLQVGLVLSIRDMLLILVLVCNLLDVYWCRVVS